MPGSGFGNHLHLIATTLAHSLRMGEPCEVMPCVYDRLFPNWSKWISRKRASDIRYSRVIGDKGFARMIVGDYERPFPRNKKLRFQGYFESEEFFKDYAAEVRDLFDVPCPEYAATGIHVRRTDLTAGRCVELTKRYYREAMRIVGASEYLVCSDDIEYCKQMFQGDEFTFVEEQEPFEDWITLRGCANLIIANSTFSWWAAYLCNSPTKKVVMPDRWFLNDKTVNARKYVDGWIQIPYDGKVQRKVVEFA